VLSGGSFDVIYF